MNIRLLCVFLFQMAMAPAGWGSTNGEVAAYYTRITSDHEFEQRSRTGAYADIVVEVGGGKLCFWRGSSYLPYWETDGGRWFVEELVPRRGDGPPQRPDRVNRFSRVALIESRPERAVVLWRYLPTFSGSRPPEGVDATEFVEELFTINNRGVVERVVRKGAAKVDEWRDPANRTVQRLRLGAGGVETLSTRAASLTPGSGEPETRVSQVLADVPGDPIAWFRFDEARGDKTREAIAGAEAEIAGHKSLWKPGVSGAALQFDGYTTEVRIPSDSAPKPRGSFTVEAWVAIGAYPWSWAPIIQQSDDPAEELVAVGGGAVQEVDATKDEDDQEEAKEDEQDTKVAWDVDSGLSFEGDSSLRIAKDEAFDLTNSDYTIVARIRTREGGTIFAEAPAVGSHAPNTKSLFVADGRLHFDVGWVGAVESGRDLDDGQEHVVAVTFKHEDGAVRLYVDGEMTADAKLSPSGELQGERVLRLGFTTPDFPDDVRGFEGVILEAAFYQTALGPRGLRRFGGGEPSDGSLVAHWKRFDHDADTFVDATGAGHDARFEDVEVEESDEEGDVDEEDFDFVLKPEDDTGYFLGVDGYGHAGFKLRAGDVWEECVSETILPRRRWSHVAGVYDARSGQMTLYVNGEEAASHGTAGGPIRLSSTDLVIGKGKPRRPIRPVRANTFIDSYSFDGLIDEARVHDAALTAKQIRSMFERATSTIGTARQAPMKPRRLPTGGGGEKFGARYEHLKFYDTWDNLWRFGDYPDVVVTFDKQPTRFVFWRGAGYIPMLVNDQGHWYSNEFNETWGTSGGQGCQEPMSDKESYTNHVRIIENTDARVVVHWRYPLLDVLHVTANYDPNTGWSDWSDWYYYIYPDGIAAKTMRLWTHGERNHEWQESMAIMGPDQHPEEVLETDPAIRLVSLDGQVDSYRWVNGPPSQLDWRDKRIQIVNYKSDYDPVTIGEFQGGDVYGGELTEYAVFPSWNHWPVGQMPSDGRYATYPDRTSHSSLTHVRMPTHQEEFGDRPFEERVLLEGMTDSPPEELVAVARSWLRPPALQIHAGASSGSYVQGQRAYVLKASGGDISVSLDASADRPVRNVCLVVQNWDEKNANVAVTADGAPLDANVRVGAPRTVRTHDLVVWIEAQSTSPTTITVSRP